MSRLWKIILKLIFSIGVAIAILYKFGDTFAKAFEGQSYEFQVSGIDPLHYELFKEIFKDQVTSEIADLFALSTYDYDDKHNLKMRDWFGGCSISELSNETAEPFDAKFTALDWR